jgi:two-component system, NarL family, nitrate/nitrite response regulator NarL
MMHSALSASSGIIRVLAIDRTPMNSQLLAEALAKNPDIEICGVCCTSESALAAAASELPHVVLLSSQLEDGESIGFEVARALRSSQPDARVIMLLDSSERARVLEAFRCGAKGVFCRSESLKALAKCIQSVHVGQVWANSNELAFLLDTFAQMPARNHVSVSTSVRLSKRENDVVRAVAEGLTNREIAKQLGLTEHTVKNYLFRIFDKVGVSTRVELVLHSLSSAKLVVTQDSTAAKSRAPRSEVAKTVVISSSRSGS